MLPGPVSRSAQTHPLLRGLLVTDAGVFPHAERHLVERPSGAAGTVLILCSSGSGWVRTGNGGRLRVEPGSLAWLPAGFSHAYGTDGAASPGAEAGEGMAWTIEWAHVTGGEVAAWAELLQLPPGGGVLAMELARAPVVSLGAAWEHLERGYSLSNLVSASAALRAALANIVRLRAAPGTPGRQSAQERVAASAEWMKAHLAQPVRLDELAGLAGLSAPHYSTLFRQLTGFAPIDWLIRMRIQRACQLLDTTDDAVRAIGEQTGFSDAYYFTRSFSRVMGISPRVWRRMQKG
ncbi:MAG: AraC family transcriptional regulator [Opitutaceae bacterium]|nr:AraC family transcriptional regulator [Opitutaceae bacterium]